MAHSSEFCRVQQSLHETRAATESLPNARKVALAAASAWAREATLAAGAERRRALSLAEPEDAAIIAEFRADEAAERNASH